MPGVSYLYNLDLDSVNSMITEINAALNKSGQSSPAPAPASSGQYIIDETLTDSTTEIAKDGLNLEDGAYQIEALFALKGAQNIKMYFNKDATAGNYRTYELFGTGGAAGSQNTADNRLCHVGGDSLVHYSGVLRVALQDNGFKQKEIMITGRWGRVHDAYVFTTFNFVLTTITIPENNINHIQIISSVTSGMVKGTKFKLWRIA